MAQAGKQKWIYRQETADIFGLPNKEDFGFLRYQVIKLNTTPKITRKK